MDYTYLDSRVEELREELLADLKRWIAIPSVLGEAAPDASSASSCCCRRQEGWLAA